MIADAEGVESLAGIMGGDATAVSDDTKNIYIEAAFWWPEAVAGRSRRFNFATDAGHRFERGVDPALTAEHIEHITALVLQVCGGEAGPMDDQTLRLPQLAPVQLRVARAAKVLGMPLTQAQCAQVFDRLGLQHVQDDGTHHRDAAELALRPADRGRPDRRGDPRHRPAASARHPAGAAISARQMPEARTSTHAVRHAMAARDYQETINFSFVEERSERDLAGNSDPIRVLNPIAAPLAVMRSSLIGSLVGVLRHNLVAARHACARVRDRSRVQP